LESPGLSGVFLWIVMYFCIVNTEAEPILYQEKQRFSKWLLLLVFLPAIISGIVVFRYTETGDLPFSLIGLGVALLAGVFLSLTALESSVSAVGFSVRFVPFYRKPTLISFAEIETAEVITYKPLWEYGGWGLKKGKNGLAFSVSGKNGILITFKEPRKMFWGKHKTLLIGTQKPEEWRKVLSDIPR
jgi:hypothetical protein